LARLRLIVGLWQVAAQVETLPTPPTVVLVAAALVALNSYQQP
jgi:hypothetical protein